MDLRTPMLLYRDNELVGSFTRYGYETPWASGLFEDAEPARDERTERVASYLRWMAEHEDELPDDDDAYEELCNQQMARHEVTPADLDWCERGTWTIRTRDGIDHQVYALDFLGDHWVQWRW